MTEEEKGIEKELAECRKQAEEYLAGWKRALADYQNREKDLAREKEDLAAFAAARSVAAFLPVLDHLRAAAGQIPAETRETEWARGVGYIVKEFEDTLRGMGAERIPTDGQFDPTRHESVGVEEAAGVASGGIIRETQSGYLLGGRVIRPAKVIIAK